VVPAHAVAVGIDLAWGTRARTGLAAADRTGRLVASHTALTDDEIVAFVADHAGDGPVVVAFDAPLVVRNPTGRRPCEAEVHRRYGRYGAGAYPANLGNPAFAAGTRAWRLCDRLGLNVVSTSAADRRAIEVYPHPAMVVLLDLERVIPYKAKPGRSLEDLRAAFARLATAMEGLPELRLAESPRWHELRDRCAHAGRKSELKRAEDEIDAIFCAHLAHRWHREGSAGNDVLGDDESGCIVVPRPTGPLRPPSRPGGSTGTAARSPA
jgi:predicted RNase H-like nuclease